MRAEGDLIGPISHSEKELRGSGCPSLSPIGRLIYIMCIVKPRTLILTAICIAFVGCTRHVNVDKQMTWECAPEEYKQGYYARPDEYVRFRFVDNRRCFEVESSKNFCSDLRQTGKQEVTARFDVWGGRFFAARGYQMIEVEHRPLIDVGGWGNSGANDSTASCPLGNAVEKLKWP